MDNKPKLSISKKLISLIENHSAVITAGAIFLYVIVFSLISAWKYSHYYYNGLDLAIFNQTFYNTSSGQLFGLTIHPPTYLNDHFSPLILLLAPIYSFFRHPLALTVMLNMALAISAWPLYLFTKNLLGRFWAVMLALIMLLNPMIQNLGLFEFNMLSFALPIIFLAYYFYQKNKFWAFTAMIALALLAREDIALATFMFGALAIFDKKSIKWIAMPMALSGLYFLTAFKIISYYSVAGQYKFFYYYSYLGKNIPDILINITTHPWILIGKFFTFGNLEMILGFLLPFAFLPLIKPRYLILCLPVFLQIALGAPGGGEIILETQYATLFLPALFLAFVYGLQKIINDDYKFKLFKFINRDKALPAIILATAILYGSFTLGPAAGTIYKIINNNDQGATAIKNQVLALIPPQAPTVASYDMIANLSSRPNIYSFNYFFIGQQQLSTRPYILPDDTDYLAVDFYDFIKYEIQYLNNDLYKENYTEGPKRVRERIRRDNFGVLEIIDTYAVLKKNNSSNIKLYEISTQPPQAQFPKQINFGDKIKLLGFDKSPGLSNFVPISIYWQALIKLTDNYQLKLKVVNKNGDTLWEKIYPLAYGLYPTSEWQPDEVIKTNYWFWLDPKIGFSSTKNTPKDRVLALELIKINKGGIYLDADQSTKLIINGFETIGEPTAIMEF